MKTMKMKRRAFLKLAAGTAALPLFSIGAAANGPGGARKIRLGLIGCGGRMGLSTGYGILNSMCGPDEEIVCLAEPDPSHWDKVRAVVKAHQPQTDTSKIRAYYDYREMLEKEAKNLDAVAIATPNHHHAPAALRAMAKGLHVYVEKPMALTVEEVRLMHAMQKRTGIVAQVGNHGHSEEGMRRLVEYIRAGTIGQVREVWSFDDRLNAMLYRPPKAEPPKGMDWDSWCGPAPVCDYYAPTQDHNGTTGSATATARSATWARTSSTPSSGRSTWGRWCRRAWRRSAPSGAARAAGRGRPRSSGSIRRAPAWIP